MSSLLTDSTGRALGYIALDVTSFETTTPMRVFAAASAGAALRSGTSTAFQLKARRHGTGQDYALLERSGIDLSADAPGPIEFDLTCTGLGVSGLVRDAVAIVVGGSSAAGWNA